jgi:RNA polymerase sigma-70 factor (ECF subfamily)
MLRLLSSPKDPTPSGPAVRDQADPLRALASNAVGGDAHASRTLLVALGPALLRVVRAIVGSQYAEVEDVLQEAMVAVHAALPGFRGECSTTRFACRIAVHTAMNASRGAGLRRRLTPLTSPDELAAHAGDDPSPAEALGASRRRQALRELLEELPAAQSEVLALHIVLGHSVEETAVSTGVPVNTVRSRLRAALAALRSRLLADDARREVVETER